MEAILPISLRKFVELYIGDDLKRGLPDHELGKLIKLLDPSEVVCHIEFPSNENILGIPVIWKKKGWVNEYERLKRLRHQSEDDRRVMNKRKDLFKGLITGVRRKLRVDEETAYIIAQQCFHEKNKEVALFYGINLDDLPDEPKLRAI